MPAAQGWLPQPLLDLLGADNQQIILPEAGDDRPNCDVYRELGTPNDSARKPEISSAA